MCQLLLYIRVRHLEDLLTGKQVPFFPYAHLNETQKWLDRAEVDERIPHIATVLEVKAQVYKVEFSPNNSIKDINQLLSR